MNRPAKWWMFALSVFIAIAGCRSPVVSPPSTGTCFSCYRPHSEYSPFERTHVYADGRIERSTFNGKSFQRHTAQLNDEQLRDLVRKIHKTTKDDGKPLTSAPLTADDAANRAVLNLVVDGVEHNRSVNSQLPQLSKLIDDAINNAAEKHAGPVIAPPHQGFCVHYSAYQSTNPPLNINISLKADGTITHRGLDNDPAVRASRLTKTQFAEVFSEIYKHVYVSNDRSESDRPVLPGGKTESCSVIATVDGKLQNLSLNRSQRAAVFAVLNGATWKGQRTIP